MSELDALLQPCVARTPTTTYLGVSPPVRSGAANPWAHDRSWARSAYSASHTNLQALRELDSTGESFLKGGRHAAGRLGGSAGSGNIDAAALVLASPDLAHSVLADAADAQDDDAGCFRQQRSGGGGALGGVLAAAAVARGGALDCGAGEESLSDAGSESTQVAAAAAGAAGSAVHASAAPPCCLPPPPTSALRSRLMAGASSQQLAAAAAAPSVLQQPVAAKPPRGAPTGKPQALLEPFACHTQYYA